MDKLNIMFNEQKKLQHDLGTIDKYEHNFSAKQQYINQMILACQEELVEIMRETAYKNPDYVLFGWKKGQQFNRENYKNEIIDLWHFVMNLCIVVDMDADEFYELYCIKNKINHERKQNGY